METFLSILGCALGVVAFIPVFMGTTRRGKISYGVAFIIVLMIGLFGANTWNNIQHASSVGKSKQDIQRILQQGAKSFDQIYTEMYFPPFAVANDAIDELVEEDKVETKPIQVKSVEGNKQFAVRVYSLKPTKTTSK